MRNILVLLISFLLISPAIEAGARDLFLVRILSIDRETKQVVITIIDGHGDQHDQPYDGAANTSPEMVIASEAMALNFKPGDVARVWGSISENGKEMILQDSVSSSGPEPDPTGVRRRLRNKNSQRRPGAGYGRH
jgi:hypothetical protein